MARSDNKHLPVRAQALDSDGRTGTDRQPPPPAHPAGRASLGGGAGAVMCGLPTVEYWNILVTKANDPTQSSTVFIQSPIRAPVTQAVMIYKGGVVWKPVNCANLQVQTDLLDGL